VYIYKKDNVLDRFEGNSVNNIFEGLGTLYWKNGEKYGGSFAKDKPSGFGIKHAATKSIIYKGGWKNRKPISF
jgi:hypothetical protein